MKDKPGLFALDPARIGKGTLHCPKCGAESGDNWGQCEGVCPMPMSPHFSQEENDKYLENSFYEGEE